VINIEQTTPLPFPYRFDRVPIFLPIAKSVQRRSQKTVGFIEDRLCSIPFGYSPQCWLVGLAASSQETTDSEH
jgi:hypothetical protein